MHVLILHRLHIWLFYNINFFLLTLIILFLHGHNQWWLLSFILYLICFLIHTNLILMFDWLFLLIHIFFLNFLKIFKRFKVFIVVVKLVCFNLLTYVLFVQDLIFFRFLALWFLILFNIWLFLVFIHSVFNKIRLKVLIEIINVLVFHLCWLVLFYLEILLSQPIIDWFRPLIRLLSALIDNILLIDLPNTLIFFLLFFFPQILFLSIFLIRIDIFIHIVLLLILSLSLIMIILKQVRLLHFLFFFVIFKIIIFKLIFIRIYINV